MISFRNGREASASLARQPLFLLDNQVVRVFHLKDRLIILRAVMYEVYGRICSQVARDQSRSHWLAIFLKMAAGLKRVCLGLLCDRIDHKLDFRPGSMFV